MDNDRVEHGAWFGGSFYPERADLSHDGRYMVYFAANFGRRMKTWTAISEPPLLTAISLWFQSGTWGGGGVFIEPNRLLLSYVPGFDRQDRSDDTFHRLFQIEPTSNSADRVSLHHLRMRKNGWTDISTKERIAFEKPRPDGKLILTKTREREEPSERFAYELRDERVKTVAADVLDDEVSWADWGKRGRLVTARRGFVRAYDGKGLLKGRPDFELNCNELQPPPRQLDTQR